MTESVDVFDSSASERVPDNAQFFHYDDKLNAVLMKSPISGWEVFEDVNELAIAVDELGDAVEQAKEKGVGEYYSPFPEDGESSW